MRSLHSSLATKGRLPGSPIASCADRSLGMSVLRSISVDSPALPPPNTPAAVSRVRISGETMTTCHTRAPSSPVHASMYPL